MRAFQALLGVFFLIICWYTIEVVSVHGWNLLEVFLSQVQSMTWAGQFNVDFQTYLMLSALWVAWRSKFSALGMVGALCALILGIMFFAPYLLVATITADGDMKKVLLGARL